MAKFRWEDPSVYNVNKEDGHALFLPYDSEAEALAAESEKYKQSLNGMWKFYWQMGIDNQPDAFINKDFDDSDWDEIKVPSVWQTEAKQIYLFSGMVLLVSSVSAFFAIWSMFNGFFRLPYGASLRNVLILTGAAFAVFIAIQMIYVIIIERTGRKDIRSLNTR